MTTDQAVPHTDASPAYSMMLLHVVECFCRLFFHRRPFVVNPEPLHTTPSSTLHLFPHFVYVFSNFHFSVRPFMRSRQINTLHVLSSICINVAISLFLSFFTRRPHHSSFSNANNHWIQPTNPPLLCAFGAAFDLALVGFAAAAAAGLDLGLGDGFGGGVEALAAALGFAI